jgi:hypothetical protein
MALEGGVSFFIRRQADECAVGIALGGIAFQLGERQPAGANVRTRAEEQNDGLAVIKPAP